MGNVTVLRGVTNPNVSVELQPVDGIIEELAVLLDDARSGRLRAVAIATVRVGDVAGTVWCRPPHGEGGHTLAAAISYLQHRYAAQMVEVGAPREEADPA